MAPPPLWREGKPSPPEAKDWSTHGSLGWTLQQALDELEEQENQKGGNGEQAEDTPEADKSVAHGTNQATSDEARESHVAESEASGTMHEEEPPANQAAAPAASRRIRITPQMRSAIFEAMSERPQQQPRHQQPPPNALMKGRVVYYQRHSSKWRIQIDHVHFRRRVPLAKIRRRKEKPSLWQVSRERRSDYGGATTANSNVSCELLVYNDIE